MDKERLLARAEQELTHPFDEAHNLLHHQLVWENCLQIIENENLTGVDIDALQVAAMWHDVERSESQEGDDFVILRRVLGENGNSTADEAQKILRIAGSHSYGTTQELLEAQILFDADKLEYVNPSRGQALLDEYRSGKIDRTRITYYATIWNERINQVLGQLHFQYSKDTFTKRLGTFRAFVAQHVELKGFSR